MTVAEDSRTSRTDVEQVEQRVLASHPEMYLATAADNKPWVSGVFFAETSTFELVLILETHGRTLTAIRSNPQVAVIVSTGQPYEPFLQGAASVEILGSAEAADVRPALLAKVPQSEPFHQYPNEASPPDHVLMARHRRRERLDPGPRTHRLSDGREPVVPSSDAATSHRTSGSASSGRTRPGRAG